MSTSFFQPTRGVSYNFITAVYAIACALSIVLYAGWYVYGVCEGWWLVLAPYWALLPWSLILRRRWIQLGWNKVDMQAEFKVEEEIAASANGKKEQ